MANDRWARRPVNVEQAASSVLIEHQRLDNGGPCLCGWNELGRTHAGHQAAMLRQAGLLASGAVDRPVGRLGE